MRLLHCYSGNMFGGIETMLTTLARCPGDCPELIHEFALCFEGRLSQELREAGAVVHELGAVRFRRFWTAWKARRRLEDLLDRGKFDMVVCHTAWPYALAAPVVLKRSVPLVFWAHDVLRGRHWLERLASRTRPDLVIANSRFTAQTIPTVFPGVRTETVHCPIAAPDLDQSATARESVRAEFDANPRSVVIAHVSRQGASSAADGALGHARRAGMAGLDHWRGPAAPRG